MAWRRPGDKPLSEPMMASLLTHIRVTRPQWVNRALICLSLSGCNLAIGLGVWAAYQLYFLPDLVFAQCLCTRLVCHCTGHPRNYMHVLCFVVVLLWSNTTLFSHILQGYFTGTGAIIQLQVNSSPSGQNGHHFADGIFRCICVTEKFWIFIKISLNFVPEGLIDSNQALVEIMAWRRIGDKPLSEPMLTWFTDAYMRH